MKSYCVRWGGEDGSVCFKAQVVRADLISLPYDNLEAFFRGMALMARALEPPKGANE